MDTINWFKQTSEPLFPDIIWSKPENTLHAGKLLVIGGNSHGFSAPAEAYQYALEAGIGRVRVVLPDAVRKIVSTLLPSCEYLPSTVTGSFAQKGLNELLGYSSGVDGVSLAGDFGRNSETAILLESFLQKYQGFVSLTRDAVDYFSNHPDILFERPKTLIVVSLAQLQKLALHTNLPRPITFNMDMVQLVDDLQQLTTHYPVSIIVKQLTNIHVAVAGKVSTTKLSEDLDMWRLRTSIQAMVFWLHNPTKSFEALTTGVHLLTAKK